MSAQNFIHQVISGNTAAATDTFDNLLTKRAYELLGETKVKIAQEVFAQNIEESSDEQYDEEESNEDGPYNDYDEEELEEARIVHKYEPEGGTHSAKVYYNNDDKEFETHFFKGGKNLGPNHVYYTDDKNDAIGTAKFQVDKFHKDNLRESTEPPLKIRELYRDVYTTHLVKRGHTIADRTAKEAIQSKYGPNAVAHWDKWNADMEKDYVPTYKPKAKNIK